MGGAVGGHGDRVDEVTYVNQAAEGFLGYPAEQLKDRSASRRLILEADYDHVMRPYCGGNPQRARFRGRISSAPRRRPHHLD